MTILLLMTTRFFSSFKAHCTFVHFTQTKDDAQVLVLQEPKPCISHLPTKAEKK